MATENRHKKPENNDNDDRLFDAVGTSWDLSRHAEIPKASPFHVYGTRKQLDQEVSRFSRLPRFHVVTC